MNITSIITTSKKVIDPFRWHLANQGYAVIDGALATELQNRNCDLNDPLWSAKILLEQPDLIADVHYDYFVAGADCAITASYQATPLGFATRGLSKAQSIRLIQKSVELAKQAKTKYQQTGKYQQTKEKKPLVIAGSVGPYGAYLADGSEYTGNYVLTEEDMFHFHYDRIKALIDAKADIIAFETLPSFSEIRVLTNIIKQFPSTPCWFAFTLKDSHHLNDGTLLSIVTELLNSIEQVVSIGVNCIPLANVTGALNTLSQLTDKPLIAYPNSGEEYDCHTKEWQESKHHQLCDFLPEWQKNGAKLIGGCCRTTPADINQISKKLSEAAYSKLELS